MKFSPMLLQSLEGDAGRFLASPRYRIEEKLDGWRAIVRVNSSGVKTWSREGNVLKFSFPAKSFREIILDGEIVATKERTSCDKVAGALSDGSAKFIAFDCLKFGNDLVDLPLSERLAALEDACALFGLEQVRTVSGAPEVWAEGGEGAVIKRLDSIYRSGCRSWDWLKWKR